MTQIDAKVGVSGSVTVPAKKLFEMIRVADGDSVLFESNEKANVSVKCGGARFTLFGLSADDYPNVIDDYSGVSFSNVSASDMEELVAKTSHAMSRDDMKQNLSGIYVHNLPDSNILRAVATDGHRLAYSGIEHEAFALKKGLSFHVTESLRSVSLRATEMNFSWSG